MLTSMSTLSLTSPASWISWATEGLEGWVMFTSGGSPNSRVMVVVMVEEVVVVAPDPSTWRRLLCADSTVSSATTLRD